MPLQMLMSVNTAVPGVSQSSETWTLPIMHTAAAAVYACRFCAAEAPLALPFQSPGTLHAKQAVW